MEFLMSEVSLVSITEPKIRIDVEGNAKRYLTPEELIVYCARVSNAENQLNMETAPKLLNYCIKHGHWSIFEQVNLSFEITTSRAIAQQIIRHKTICFQELSQRYQKAQEFEPIELRKQDEKNRQNSTDDLSDVDQAWFHTERAKILNDTVALYDEALSRGIAKECARFVLPLNTRTRLYANANVRSWITYLSVRLHKSTQKEHRDIANGIKEIFIERLPVISNALDNFAGWEDEKKI